MVLDEIYFAEKFSDSLDILGWVNSEDSFDLFLSLLVASFLE